MLFRFRTLGIRVKIAYEGGCAGLEKLHAVSKP